MTTPQIYKVQRYGKLLTLKAVIPDASGIYQGIRLLVDTGAMYTTLPIPFLEALGYPITSTTKRIPRSTANGLTQAPMITINQFNCLGQTVSDFPILAVNLSPNAFVSGLLGMDFLERFGVVIKVKEAEIAIAS